MYRKVEQSQTLFINTQTQKMVDQNREVFRFGFGQSPFMPPQDVQSALGNATVHKEYSSVQGDPELREHIARFHFQHNGLRTRAEDVLVAPGSKILIFSLLMAVEKADVLIPAPAWVSYGPQAQLAGHHVITLPTSWEKRWRITADALQKAVTSKKCPDSILILNYPGNPDGLTYSREELMELAHVARTHGMMVISDEIYGLLDHKNTHLSFAAFYPERTITTTGLSKWCGAGGWRLGAALLSEGLEPELKEALLGIGSETYSCAPVPVQMAAKVAYQDYATIKSYIHWQTRILKAIGHYCCEKLVNAGIKVHPPEGGFYLFLDFSEFQDQLKKRGIATSTAMCSALLDEKGVVLLPSQAFGFEPSFPGARLAYVDFDEPPSDLPFDMKAHAPKISGGIRALVDWVRDL
ncbi:pyridoxal phosphate-dependent aminotransferase [Muriicola sp.]|uniref:pyridoxal phosphate-dependent aminotransferase n=2 Tax=Muriicola sp. TaxID=2020856 RepID=UPI00356B421E